MKENKKDAFTGILPVFKEKGYTSNDVVAKLRGILKMRRTGHTGTLDPEAEGVLPVCLGRATKAAGFLTDSDKTYRCVMRLGIATDTEDMTGKILRTSDCSELDEERTEKAILSFVGEYDQIPPMYSAKKINGKKLYELAREGIEIERKPSRVFIRSISDIKVHITGEKCTAEFTVECSRGTYIRSLCRDIGDSLGCGGCMESLIRTRACGIGADECITLSRIEELTAKGVIGEYVIPIDRFYGELGEIKVSGVEEKLVRNGNIIPVNDREPGRYRVYLEDGTFAALYDVKDGEARLCRMFL